MKLKIKSIDGKGTKEVALPSQFNEPIRRDLIKRAVLVIQSNNYQPNGADPEAGKRASSYLSKRRNSYRSTYGIGQSRTPRKVMSRRGTRLNYTGAFAPQTVGGRRSHAPKAEKILSLKINKKERRKAIRSAMAAVFDKNILSEKNYVVPEDYPFILDNSFESLSKTSEVISALKNLKISVPNDRKIRAGKGKLRGRRYTKKKGPLFVTNGDCQLFKSAPNMNAEIVSIKDLNTELLAPGASPGRIVLFTEGAIARLKEENLFTEKIKVVKKVVDKKVGVKPININTKINTPKENNKKAEVLKK